MMKLQLRWSLGSALFIGLVFTACVIQKSPVTGDRRAYAYSWEQEKKIGAKADKQIQQQFGVYQNESLQNYVDQVAKSVLAVSDMRDEGTPQKYLNTEFHFRVLNSPIVNAFALPGGYVYVTRGLLAHLQNEAQLAVVLGHEIGHVAARHASQSALERQLGQLALIGGAVAGQEILGIPGRRILNLGSTAAKYLFLSYSRDDERESDQLGVEYASKQGYAAAEAAEFFVSLRRLSAQSGQSIPNWLSSHPDPSERAQTIPALAEHWRQEGYELNEKDTDQYMQEIENIVYGNNPRQGFTRNGHFYHPELAFKFPYPENWTLVNRPTVVQIINPDKNAIMIFQIDSKNNSVRASVNEFLQQEGINPVGASKASSGELNAYEATATGQTQGGADVSFYIYAVKYDGNIYRFVSYTLSEQFDAYKDVFVKATNQFEQVTDSGILNIQPARLHIFKANKTAPFSSFVPENLPLDITAEEVAITNQVRLDETVEAGTYIKIPEQ